MMNENVEQPKTEKPAATNEHAGFYFSSFLKITDTESNEVIVQVRGEK